MFSVIVPTKNEEELIERLLKSIISQGVQPDEIIVADKSTDRTAEIAKEYGAKVVEGADDGFIGKGRNNGARYAKTDLFFFIDADVFIPEGFFADALRIFHQKKLDIATCYLRADRKRIVNYLYFNSWNALKRFGSVTKKVLAESGICLLVKKDLFTKICGFSEKISVGEDSDFIRRAVKAGGRFKVLPLTVITSDRRFRRPMRKLAVQLIGLAGMFAVSVVGINMLRKNMHKFEKMYGETGGGK
ncbi:glycosyltransferase [Candidatus Dojkabacteria bacterium]|nr:glycosyltransferase [Candidatus Dojkabacteria bacterium]